MDCDGPKIADKFYSSLFGRGNMTGNMTHALDICPDAREAALALHLAVDQLRSETPDFARWVPFVHFGI
jgi:hypothetical protein